MDIAPLLLLTTVLWKVIDFLRLVANFKTNRSAVVTMATAFVGGVFAVVLASHASLFDHFDVNGLTLTQLDVGSQIFLGLGIASLAGVGVDIKAAIDGSDSAAKPPLLPPNP